MVSATLHFLLAARKVGKSNRTYIKEIRDRAYPDIGNTDLGGTPRWGIIHISDAEKSRFD
jgi:hypothetical protein